MEGLERLFAIYGHLIVYGSAKVSDLAERFSVSERTILRDISILSCNGFTYTDTVRGHSGVFIEADRTIYKKNFLNADEEAALRKMIQTHPEEQALQSILNRFSRMQNEKQENEI